MYISNYHYGQLWDWSLWTCWSFLFRQGDKHDKKIGNCYSTPKLVQAHDSALSLTIFFNFSHDKTLNLIVFGEISFSNVMFLCSIKTEMFTGAES